MQVILWDSRYYGTSILMNMEVSGYWVNVLVPYKICYLTNWICYLLCFGDLAFIVQKCSETMIGKLSWFRESWGYLSLIWQIYRFAVLVHPKELAQLVLPILPTRSTPITSISHEIMRKRAREEMITIPQIYGEGLQVIRKMTNYC